MCKYCTLWPLAERSACRVDQISGAYGWWGERTRFLTSLPSCRTENYVPGLHLLTFQHPRNQSQPDKVWQVQSWALMTLTLDAFSFLCSHIWFSPPKNLYFSVCLCPIFVLWLLIILINHFLYIFYFQMLFYFLSFFKNWCYFLWAPSTSALLLSHTHVRFFVGVYPAQYLHHPQSLYRDGCDPAVSGIHSSVMGRPSSCSTTSGNCCHVGSNSEAPLHCSNGCWTQLSSTGMEYHKIRFPLLDKKVMSLQIVSWGF